MIVCQGIKRNGRRCGNILGERTADGHFEMRHRGRRATGLLIGPESTITCEDCGTTTTLGHHSGGETRVLVSRA